MGAFGVALEVLHRIRQGLLKPARFDLKELLAREVTYRKPFKCSGGRDRCDRGCEIARIRVGNKTFPFGGICNRFDNIVHHRKLETSGLNLVLERERRLFRDLRQVQDKDMRPTVGMNRSFLINTYFPFFNTFFQSLGHRLVLPDRVDPKGVDQRGAAFCFPAELAHGFMGNLLEKRPNRLFLPHIKGIPTESGPENSCTCVLLQGEPFYLRSAFPEISRHDSLRPRLDFSKDIHSDSQAFVEIGKWLGADRQTTLNALGKALEAQEQFRNDIREMGRAALEQLDGNPDEVAVVLLGRPYNAFTAVANKGIPAKFATRGIRILPMDMIPFEKEPLEPEMNMYWGMGRMILQVAGYVKRHPRLFAALITNFSCGPDSFLVGYVRDIMGRKPSLTLELDSHTADAGLETRIEAFLDIVSHYRQIEGKKQVSKTVHTFKPARMESREGTPGVVSSSGKWVALSDKRVRVVIPNMHRFGTSLLAKALGRGGITGLGLPPADEDVLKLGRANSSCKECLPLQLTVGSLLAYLKNRDRNEITVYLMPSAEGPCRFGQYNVFSRKVIAKHQIPDVAIFSPSVKNSYGGLGDRVTLACWRTIVIGDLLEEIHATVLAGAKDRELGMAVLNREVRAIHEVVDKDWKVIARQLERSARNLSEIELKRPYPEIPKISLVGEIYVRHEAVSRQGIIERMAEKGFIVRTAPVSEWMKYADWLIKVNMEGERSRGFLIRYFVKRFFDRRIRKKLAPSGLFYDRKVEIRDVIDQGRHFVSPSLTGEAILTVGSSFHEILSPACGVISIGPFGCMPSRVAEAILSENFTAFGVGRINPNGHKPQKVLLENRKLPFLAIETDGNPFPQIIEARLEAFCLQAQRLHEQMLVQHRH
jgi:predicted nucleotide-binding protein (sugar kinase/HSP70/actin superfamily)